MNNNFFKAFTLVENMVVFTILGIIIAIVTPTMIRSNNEKKTRLIMRKSVMTYQTVLNKILSETTGIASEEDLNELITKNNCALIRSELSIAENKNCTFMTQDGVWWNVSTSNKAILSTESADALTADNAVDDENKKTFFVPYIVRNDANSVKSVSILKLPSDATETEKSAAKKTSDFLIAD